MHWWRKIKGKTTKFHLFSIEISLNSLLLWLRLYYVYSRKIIFHRTLAIVFQFNDIAHPPPQILLNITKCISVDRIFLVIHFDIGSVETTKCESHLMFSNEPAYFYLYFVRKIQVAKHLMSLHQQNIIKHTKKMQMIETAWFKTKRQKNPRHWPLNVWTYFVFYFFFYLLLSLFIQLK